MERTDQETVQHAVILAAGAGIRFKDVTNEIPKPLVKVAGIPIIERTIRSANKAGIRYFTVITGFHTEKLEAFLKERSFPEIEITCLKNSAWQKPNGISARMARGRVPDPFVLLMADHLFEPAIIRYLLKKKLPPGICRLAVDFRLDRILDLDDATRVRVVDDQVTDIGKHLHDYNAIDTGIFLCSGALFKALDRAIARRKESLSDGIRELAHDRQMEVVDIGDFYWQDIDTEQDRKHAETQLLKSLVSQTDSWLTRNINRRISLAVTRRLAKTRIKPNQITLFNFFLALFGAGFTLRGSYAGIVVGCTLFLLASILDGCDGEVARLKFQNSRLGAWLDIGADNVAHMAFFVCMTFGLICYKQSAVYLVPGAFMVLGSLASFFMATFAQKRLGRGQGLIFSESPLQSIHKRNESKSLASILDRLANRDFTYLLLFLACLGKADWFLWIAAAGATLFAALFYKTLRQARTRLDAPYLRPEGEK